MSRVITALGTSSVQSLRDTVRAEKTRVQKGPLTPVSQYQAPGAILSVKTLELIKGSKPPTIFSGEAQLLQPDLAALVAGDSELDVSGSEFKNGEAVKITLWNQSRFPVPKGETIVAKRDARGLWVCD